MMREYAGCFITRSTSVHWRWEAWVDPRQSSSVSGSVYADTLADMRDLLRHHNVRPI